MSVSQESVPTPSRRTVVAVAGAAGLTAALTACGNSDDSQPSNAQSGGKEASGGGSDGTALAKASDIPVGGGMIFKEQGVVVTQPTQGQFKAFSSKCTHQGCAVSTVERGTINCPCHKSEFSIEDGSVKKAPATKPLEAKQITVSGDEIKLA